MSGNLNSAVEWYCKYYSDERVLAEKGTYFKTLKIWEEEVTSKYFPSNARILDIGCGMGREAFILNDMGFNITGIDVSVNAINVASEFALETNRNITFMVTNGTDLPFDDNSFDVVVIWNQTLGIIYGENRQIAFLKECSRVLKTDGVISFSGHDREYIELKYPQYISDKKFFPFEDRSIHWEMFTINEIEELAQKARFNIIKCQRGMLRNEEDGTILHCICKK